MKQYSYLIYWASSLVILVLLGFYNSYFSLFPDFKNISGAVHFHTAVMSIWLVLIVLQPMLLYWGKINLHRIAGKFSYFIAPFIFGAFLVLIVQKYLYDQSNMSWERNTLLRSISFISTASFMSCYLLAIKNVKHQKRHMQYMISTGITLFPPAFARVLYAVKVSPVTAELSTLFITILFIIALMHKDKTGSFTRSPYGVVLSFHLVMLANYIILFRLVLIEAI